MSGGVRRREHRFGDRSARRLAGTALLVVTLGAGSGAGCSDGRPPTGARPSAGRPAESPLYVAVGASESVGFGTEEPLRHAWTQVFYRKALPRRAVFVNLGVPGATVADALERQLPEALALRPSLVTVWLNVNDLVGGVGPADYERDLAELIGGLRRGGAVVLVANTPELDRLPAYVRCREGSPGPGCTLGRILPPELLQRVVAAYNAAIERVAAQEGASLVDLHSAALAARAAGTEASLVSDDGFHPSVAGHRLVADAFAEALASSDALPSAIPSPPRA